MGEEIEDGELRDDDDDDEKIDSLCPSECPTNTNVTEKNEKLLGWQIEPNDFQLDCVARKSSVNDVEWSNRLHPDDIHTRRPRRDFGESRSTKDDGNYSSSRDCEYRKRGWKRKGGRRNRHKEDVEKRRTKKMRRNRHSGNHESSGSYMGDEDIERPKDGNQDDYELVFVRGASPVKEDFRKTDSLHSSISYESNIVEQGSSDIPVKQDIQKETFGNAKNSLKTEKRSLSRNDHHSRKKKAKKGSKNKKRTSTSSKNGSNASVCSYYMQGKCNKKSDCPFSHEACPPRKMEVCRYYLMDVCAKKDKCLYMHQDFPCKFFHTGMKCFSGDKCKFSHGTLSDTMKNVLFKHLKCAPKNLQSTLPWPNHDGNSNMSNSCTDPKKIPSLFDIEVPVPALLSVTQREHRKECSPKRGSSAESKHEGQDGTLTPMPLSPSNDDNFKGMNRLWGSDETDISHLGSSKVFGDQDYFSVDKPNIIRNDDPPKIHDRQDSKPSLLKSEPHDPDADIINADNSEVKGKTEKKSKDVSKIPLHLPKKQLELFLRIQKHQREADTSNDPDYSKAFGVNEEKYCSSDDEDSLTNIMENISKVTQSPDETLPIVNSNNFQNHATKAANLEIQDLAKIQRDESVIKLLSSIDLKNILDTASATPTISSQESALQSKPCTMRDPRRAREAPSRGLTLDFGNSSDSVGHHFLPGVAPVDSARKQTLPYLNKLKINATHSSPEILPAKDNKYMSKNNSHSESDTCLSKRQTLRSHLVPKIGSNSDYSGDSSMKIEGENQVASDIDLRKGVMTSTPALNASRQNDVNTFHIPVRLPFGDIDLRLTPPELIVNRNISGNDTQTLGSTNNKDVDWRKFPFKPVPVPTPATEIRASLSSHSPILYNLSLVTIPKPDFSSVKLSVTEQQVHKDPRLRKIFNCQYLGKE